MFLDDHPVFERANGERLTLHVHNMLIDMMESFNTFNKEVHELPENAGDEAKKKAALHYASAIFGKEQANTLFDFYGGSMVHVMEACNNYMERLLNFLEKVGDTHV